MAGLVVRSDAAGATARRMLPGVRLVSFGDRVPAGSALLLAVADAEIAPVASALVEHHNRLPSIALHTSGVLPASALHALQQAGVHVGSLHPLVSFPSADGPLVPLEGVTAALEGQPVAVAAAGELAQALGMRPHRIAAAAKPLYHAAAALAGNLTHVLVRLAVEQMSSAGFAQRDAAASLAPLVDSAVRAALEASDWSRLTGAVARADAATVSTHLAALPDDVSSIYRTISEVALGRLATSENIDRSSLKAVRAALTTDTLCASVPVMRRREGN